MKNKANLKKWALIVVSAMLLVCVSVGATIAYLTSTDKVENTFTVGKVAITLDEAKVNVNGQPTDEEGNVLDVAAAPRVEANGYKLMPGHTYTKDPTVHVAAGSEDCWVFVKVENGISDFETTEEGKSIVSQILGNKWNVLATETGVYYKKYTSNSAVVDMKVFEQFKIADNANTLTGWADVSKAKVTVTAYAIQADGFDTADKAWTAYNADASKN